MTTAPRIAVIGSANIDLVTYTSDFPRPGETIFAHDFKLGFGGKGANQAVAAQCCGGQVSMIARVGQDLFGPAYVEAFRGAGIDTTHVHITPGVSSGVAPILVDSNGQNRIWVIKGANDRVSPADIDAAADLLRSMSCIILQLEIPIDTVYYALRFARMHGIPAILNPAPATKLDPAQISNADWFVPNESEAATISGMPVNTAEEAKSCAQAFIAQGLPRVILTLGANGALLATRDGIEHIPAFAAKPVDTTGAGDAFIGAFAVFLASDLAPRDAVRRANLFAAMSTERKGTQSSYATRAEFDAEWVRRGESVQ